MENPLRLWKRWITPIWQCRWLKWFGLLLFFLIMQFSQPASGETLSIMPICQIQGTGFSSGWKDQFVTVQGVVTADFDRKRGLIAIQQPNCDQDPRTSDAIWVTLAQKAEVVEVGDWIQVSGTVRENYGRTEIQSRYDQMTILEYNHPLPEPEELAPPQNNIQSNRYYEAREAMLVRLDSGNVIGPTDSYGNTWLMPASLGVSRLFYNDLRGTGGVFAVDERGDFALEPALRVGDQVQELVGVLDEAYESYRLYLLNEPTIMETPFWGFPQAPPLPNRNAFRLATFNLANLFDTEDDPNTNDSILTKAEYRRRLRKRALAVREVLGEPELIAVQEVENELVLRDLLAQPEISAPYQVIWEDSPDPRGLDVALLYRSDRIFITDVRPEQGCTDLVDGLGPDGNQNVVYPENYLTCDRNGDGVLDGNRLFLRPPLVVKLEVLTAGASCSLIVIVNHWKSKVEDTRWTAYTLDRRTQEAAFTAELVQRLRVEFPSVPIVLAGDLNDYSTSPPLQKLLSTGVVDLTQSTAPEQHYSYIYRGVSQNIDYVFLDAGKGLKVYEMTPLHFNADYPYPWTSNADTPIRASDHDVWQAIFYFPFTNYLPLLTQNVR